MNPIGLRPLGKSGLKVTALGFGGVPIGDFWTRMPDEVALATVRRAADAGLGLFDTSPLYGHGLSEHRIGQVLRQRPRTSFCRPRLDGFSSRCRSTRSIADGLPAG
jgi:D-threo-aldose 1-dehydrogenase